MGIEIVTVICTELEEAIGEVKADDATRGKELVRREVDTVAIGEEAVFNNVEIAGAIEVDTDRVGELNVSASSIHVVSYMTGEVAVALPRTEDGEMLTLSEADEETADTGLEGMLAVGTRKESAEENVELATELELPVKIPLPSVLELAGVGEKTILGGMLEDKAELEVPVDSAAEPGGDDATETDEAFDRMPVMTGSEAYEGKTVLIEDETAPAIKFVDGPLGEIGELGVKDVLFQKLWHDFPLLTGIGGWVVAEDTAVRRVEVRTRNSVDLTIFVVLLDGEVVTEVDAGGELVAITAMTLVLEVSLLVGDNDTVSAGEYGEYPPW